MLRDARSAISAIDGVRPRVAVSSSAAIATVRLASFARRVTWTDHVLSRKCRRSSPRIVGTANVLNARPREGSNRSTALTSPRNATCARSSRDSPRCANRCVQYDTSHAWSSTRALRMRRSPLARHCSNRASSCSRERWGGVTAPPSDQGRWMSSGAYPSAVALHRTASERRRGQPAGARLDQPCRSWMSRAPQPACFTIHTRVLPAPSRFPSCPPAPRPAAAPTRRTRRRSGQGPPASRRPRPAPRGVPPARAR